LCANHHTVIDGDDATYTAEVLREMKHRHEARATKEFVITDDLAARIATFMAGGAVASGLAGFAREIGSTLAEFARKIGRAVWSDPYESDDLQKKLIIEIWRY
jgi:hypothetical protein